jgi:hypothetical protein
MLAALLVSGLSACGNGSSTTATAPMVNNKGLWIANGTNVLEYVPSQLVGGTSAALPHLVNSSPVFGSPQGVTFDAHGNLWVMDPAGIVNGVPTPALFEFSAAQLAALATNPKPEPMATIVSTALKFPEESVFDSQGNLWVTDHSNDTVVVFTAAELARPGTNSTMPAAIISSAEFNGPLGIAFDGKGDLWVANNGHVPTANGATSAIGTTIVEFLAAHLSMPPATGMLTPYLTPDVVLSDDGHYSIQGPWALAFDSMGNLWSSNVDTPFTLVEFSMTSLAMTGAPMPSVTLSPTMANGYSTLNSPKGICFDNVGDIAAVNSAGTFGIDFFTRSQLTTGSPIPYTFIVGATTTLKAPAGCTFGTLVN